MRYRYEQFRGPGRQNRDKSSQRSTTCHSNGPLGCKLKSSIPAILYGLSESGDHRTVDLREDILAFHPRSWLSVGGGGWWQEGTDTIDELAAGGHDVATRHSIELMRPQAHLHLQVWCSSFQTNESRVEHLRSCHLPWIRYGTKCQVDKPHHEHAGGHTTEGLALVSGLDFARYTPRTYIISDGDTLSAQKAHELEERKRVSGG